MKKFVLFLLTLCAATVAMAQAFTPNPITPPDDLKAERMAANVTSQSWNYTLDLEVLVGFHGGSAYIQGLLPDFPYAWIKGDVSAGTISFAAGQFLDYFGDEGYSYELYACGFSAGSNSVTDFVLTLDPETGIMKSENGMGIGEYMEYEGSLYDLDKISDVTISPISDESGEAVIVPKDAEFKTYYLSAEDMRNGPVEYEAGLAFVDDPSVASGQAVYLVDFCDEANVSGAAIKGYRSDDETIVFPSEQFLERYEDSYDIYFYGASYDEETGHVTTGDFILDYDAATDTYHSRFTGILISIGKVTSSEISFSEFLQDVVLLSAEGESDAIRTARADRSGASTVYSLSGCKARAAKGIIIAGGRKSLK